MPIVSVRHIGIKSWNIEEQYDFFSTLGITPISDEMEPREWIIKHGVHDHHLLKGYKDINILKYKEGMELLKGKPFQMHISLNVVNIEDVYNKVVNMKYKILSDGILENDKVKLFFCEGPDGVIYEMVEEHEVL
jgi:hypothetical protein